MHQKAGAVRCDIHRLYDVTVANVDDTTPRGEHIRHRLRLLGITVNLAKSILTPLLNRTYNTTHDRRFSSRSAVRNV
jgi:hypothetical protein